MLAFFNRIWFRANVNPLDHKLRTRANSPSIEEEQISLEGKASHFLGEGRTNTSPNPFALDFILMFFGCDIQSVLKGSTLSPAIRPFLGGSPAYLWFSLAVKKSRSDFYPAGGSSLFRSKTHPMLGKSTRKEKLSFVLLRRLARFSFYWKWNWSEGPRLPLLLYLP